MYYTNANGLVKKMNELRMTLYSKNIDIACVTETHFNSSLYDSEVEINGYNCFRQNRNLKEYKIFLKNTKFYFYSNKKSRTSILRINLQL